MAYIKINQYKDHKSHINDVTKALSIFKKEVKKSGILQDLRKHDFFISKPRKRRFKTENCLKQRRRDEKKQEWSQKNSKF